MALDPTFHPWAQCGIGLGRYRLRQPEEAIRHLESAIHLAPTFTQAWNSLGLARKVLKDWAGAVTAFERAAELDPALPEIADNLHDARKGLANQREQEKTRAKPLKPLHRYLLLVALVGAILSAAMQLLLLYLNYFGDYFDFMESYFWVIFTIEIAQDACIISGLVGLWLVTGRPRPWLLIFGIVCVCSSYINLLLFFIVSEELYFYGSFYCATQMLSLLAHGSYLATYSMAWRGKPFPKVAFAIQCVTAACDVIVEYFFSCFYPTAGLLDSAFMMVAYFAMAILTPLMLATLQLNVAFWITTLRQLPLPKHQVRISPPGEERVFREEQEHK